jgi:hypothetical protein
LSRSAAARGSDAGGASEDSRQFCADTKKFTPSDENNMQRCQTGQTIGLSHTAIPIACTNEVSYSLIANGNTDEE